jgi:hypothetical protein
MLNGIAFSGSDDNGFGLNSDDSKRSFDLFVNTKYRLADADQWLKIVDGNTDLIQTTWVSLCAITADEEGGFAVALDSMTAGVNSNKRVQLEVNPAGLIGDATILKVAYQVNFLIKKAVG